MSIELTGASFDWQIVATGAGILIASIWATYQGLKKGKEKVEQGNVTTLVGGSLMDNLTMRELTEALRQNTEVVREHTRQLERHADLLILIGRFSPRD